MKHALLAIAALALAACTDDDNTVRTLQSSGFTEISVTGYVRSGRHISHGLSREECEGRNRRWHGLLWVCVQGLHGEILIRHWFPIVAVVALACAMLFTAVAHSEEAAPPSLASRIEAVVPSLASRKDEPVNAREFAQAVADVSKGNRQWAAFLTTLASHESGLSDRIRRGEYKSFEGDSYRDAAGTLQHKSWGIFQVQRSPVNAHEFGSPDVAAQVRAGSRMARGAFYQCAKSGVPFPLGAFRALGGRGCLGKLKGEEKRVATFNRVLARIQ